MVRHEAILRKFYAKYMSAETLRKDVIDLYSENFTEKELKEITAFYNTKAGQKALEKLPEIMKGSMQIAQTRVMQNMSELQNMISQSNVILTK